jgi:hypothetical protein
MSLFSKLNQSPLSLNLGRSNDTPEVATHPMTHTIDPALLHAAVPAIKERANAMFDAGIRPGSLYLAIEGASQGMVVFRTPKFGAAALVFTSSFQAADYLKESKIPGGVHEFPATTLQSYMEDWKSSGAGAFALDRCPRCPVWLPIPIKDGITYEQICRVWAIHRTTRIFQAQRCIRFFMDTTPENNLPDHVENRKRKREALESIRDHLDCSVPYLHWMIAIEAGMSHDEEVRLAAIERLSEFGPMFCDKATLSSEGDAWAQAVAECQVGLLRSFEMLRLP